MSDCEWTEQGRGKVQDGHCLLWLPSWSMTFTLAADFSTKTLRILLRCLVDS